MNSAVLFAIEAFFWLGAYFMILRLAFKEKTYGMPIVAMCGNIAWEFLYGIGVFPACAVTRTDCTQWLIQGGNFAAFIMDCTIVYTILRFGRQQFRQPIMEKYFPYIVFMGIGVAILVIYVLDGFLYVVNPGIVGQPDFLNTGLFGGAYTGFGQALVMSLLFPAMLAARNSLNGQSFLIALAMALGNTFAYAFNLSIGIRDVPTQTLSILSIAFNFVYVVLVYQKSKDLGVSLWK